MKFTNRELQMKVQTLNMLSNRQLPVKVSYALAKNLSVINKELKIVDGEKQKLIKDYALKDESGNPKTEGNKILFPDQEKENECNEKYNELLDIETEIKIRTVNITELLNSNLEFSPAELIELDFMLVE